jgi:hypothetical protein
LLRYLRESPPSNTHVQISVSGLSEALFVNMADSVKLEAIQAEDADKNQVDTTTELKRAITVDTIHNDEAVKVLANYGGDETWTEKEEKKVQRKIDRRLLPILCATYGLQVSAAIKAFLEHGRC